MAEPLTSDEVEALRVIATTTPYEASLSAHERLRLLATIDALRAERDALHTELDRVRHERGAQAVRLRACDVRIEDVTAERDAAVQRAEEAERCYLECARAAGIVYEAEGQGDAPGPIETVAAAIRSNSQRAMELEEERRHGLAVNEECDALAVQVTALREALADVLVVAGHCARCDRGQAALALDLPAAAKLAEARAKVCERARVYRDYVYGGTLVTRGGQFRREDLGAALAALDALEGRP